MAATPSMVSAIASKTPPSSKSVCAGLPALRNTGARSQQSSASEPKQASGKKQRTDERTVLQRIYDWFFGFWYTTRVTVTFSLVAIMTVVVAMGVLSYVWEEHFQAYTRENVQQLADTTAANIANRYEAKQLCNA